MKNVNEHVEEEETKVADMIWGIEDTENTWKDAKHAIDKAVFNNAEKNGVTKKVYT